MNTKEYEKKRYSFLKKYCPWKNILKWIKTRCNNPNFIHYKTYGGRGIKCLITEKDLKELWFRDRAYLMEKPSIDRINNDKNEVIKIWNNQAEINRNTEYSSSIISRAIKNNQRRYGYFWKNLVVLLFLCLIFSSCSLIPRITFSKPNTIPQKIEKSEKRIRCRGDIVLDELGKVKTCTEGFYANESYFNQLERKLSFAERLGNFIANLKGWLFWIFVVAIIFVPGLAGWLIGSVFNGFRTTLEHTVRAISRAKKNGGNFMDELNKEHSKNKNVKKTINKIRSSHGE